MKKFKVDLHLHTTASHDAVITFKDLKKAHQAGKFDAVAITDHGTISAALKFAKRNEFPVIIGEEIETQDGDVIGLFLKKEIAEHLKLEETMFQIHAQGGLVYIPHPFDFLKFGLRKEKILQNLATIDLFETHNYRYGAGVLRRNPKEFIDFAQKHQLVAAAGSDAHIPSEIGKAFLEFENVEVKIFDDAQMFLNACCNAVPTMPDQPGYRLILRHLTNLSCLKKSFWPTVRSLLHSLRA